MFNWIIKPYIQWSIIDTMLCYVELAIFWVIIGLVIVEIQDLIEKIRDKNKRG